MSFLNADGEHLRDLAARYVDGEIDKNSIWKLYRKGFLYEFFKSDNTGSGCDHLAKFSEAVSEVLNKKLDCAKRLPSNTVLKGRWLFFDPSSTMYDEVAEVESLGFFDSCDVPPPEFWVEFYNDVLISFIPENFLDLAILGVDSCISGSLFWEEDIDSCLLPQVP